MNYLPVPLPLPLPLRLRLRVRLRLYLLLLATPVPRPNSLADTFRQPRVADFWCRLFSLRHRPNALQPMYWAVLKSSGPRPSLCWVVNLRLIAII